MAKSVSAKGLFLATKRKVDKGEPLPMVMPQIQPRAIRDPLDYDPTPPDATAAFLSQEIDHIRAHGDRVWENAVGGGHMAGELARWGLDVVGSDIVDRGWPGTILRPFYAWTGEFDSMARAPSKVIISNPPYNEINASQGHGRWLSHSLALGSDYVAYLLNADWAAARINGMDAIFERHPPSIEYLCCWKIDFRGGGSPPQRNSFYVWDKNRPPVAPGTWIRKRLYRDNPAKGQGSFDGV